MYSVTWSMCCQLILEDAKWEMSQRLGCTCIVHVPLRSHLHRGMQESSSGAGRGFGGGTLTLAAMTWRLMAWG